MNKKILIVAPSWVGDMVMAEPLLRFLANQGNEVHVLALPWIEKVVACMQSVNKIHSMPVGHRKLELSTRYEIGKQLRQEQYSQAIVLPNTIKSALIPLFAKIPHRTGFHGESRYGLLNDRRILDKEKMPRLVERYYSLGFKSGEPVHQAPNPTLHANRQVDMQRFGITDMQKAIALCPGAEFGPAKQWPAQHYAELANRLFSDDYQVWLFGSEKDRAVCEEINQLTSDRCLNLAGETELDEAISIMALVDGVVTNDSGLMHIACALDKSVVAVYGSTSPGYTPPLSSNARVVSEQLECSPCFQRVCPLGHTQCLWDVTPESVHQKITELCVS